MLSAKKYTTIFNPSRFLNRRKQSDTIEMIKNIENRYTHPNDLQTTIHRFGISDDPPSSCCELVGRRIRQIVCLVPACRSHSWTCGSKFFLAHTTILPEQHSCSSDNDFLGSPHRRTAPGRIQRLLRRLFRVCHNGKKTADHEGSLPRNLCRPGSCTVDLL